MNFLYLSLVIPVGLMLIACSQPPEMRTPTPNPTPIVFPTPLPTPTPAPTPDFSGVFSALGDLQATLDEFRGSTGFSEPNASESDIKTEGDSYDNKGAGDATTSNNGSIDSDGVQSISVPQGTSTPTKPTPTPTPRPTPTPTPPVGFYVGTAPSAAQDLPGLLDGFKVNVQWAGDTLRTVTVTGVLENVPNREPTMVQVWQAQRNDGTPSCSTARPVAFVVPGSDNIALGTTDHRWRFCVKDGSNFVQVSEVPWFRASSWSWVERKRRYTTEPRIWDFSMSADFSGEESLANEYYDPSGWRVVVFSGSTIIGYLWFGM